MVSSFGLCRPSSGQNMYKYFHFNTILRQVALEHQVLSHAYRIMCLKVNWIWCCLPAAKWHKTFFISHTAFYSEDYFVSLGFLVVGTDDSAVLKRPLKRECGSGLISNGRQVRILWRVVVSQQSTSGVHTIVKIALVSSATISVSRSILLR
jgi:hypothetical protein